MPTKRSAKAFARGAGPGLDDPCAFPGKDLIKRRNEIAVTVADQEPEGAGAITEVYEQVAACEQAWRWASGVPMNSVEISATLRSRAGMRSICAGPGRFAQAQRQRLTRPKEAK